MVLCKMQKSDFHIAKMAARRITVLCKRSVIYKHVELTLGHMETFFNDTDISYPECVKMGGVRNLGTENLLK